MTCLKIYININISNICNDELFLNKFALDSFNLTSIYFITHLSLYTWLEIERNWENNE